MLKGVNNWLDLAEFFWENYQHTAREKLLDWMKDARDIDDLRKLSQRDLAITYCERIAWAADIGSEEAADSWFSDRR